MTAVRDSLCNLQRMEIPRPKCVGMQFVATRGRMGFYQTIRRDGEKYGVHIKPQGPRRPALPSSWPTNPFSTVVAAPSTLCEQTVREEEPEEEAPEDFLGQSGPKCTERESVTEPTPDYNGTTIALACPRDRIALPVANPPPAPPLSLWGGNKTALLPPQPFIAPRLAARRNEFNTAVGVKF